MSLFRASSAATLYDSARRWWLERFSDHELGAMAAAVFRREPDIGHIAPVRARLARALEP